MDCSLNGLTPELLAELFAEAEVGEAFDAAVDDPREAERVGNVLGVNPDDLSITDFARASQRGELTRLRRPTPTRVRALSPRARSSCGGRRRPRVRRTARAHAPPGDSEGEPHPPGYRRSSRSLLHVGPIESRR
jgi:hypothetical protein